MNCHACTHGPVPCGHPLVMPFEGEPPSQLGSRIADWLADNVVPAKGRAKVRREARGCLGMEEKR